MCPCSDLYCVQVRRKFGSLQDLVITYLSICFDFVCEFVETVKI